MQSAVVIRSAQQQDCDVIADLNCQLAMETEDRPLDRDTVLAGVTRGMALTGDVEYLVAEVDGRVVGQLMLTREWSDWRDGWMIWLQSVFVTAEHRRKGVFRSLLSHAISSCREQPDVVGMRLYVENQNLVAQQTYERLGFTDEEYRVMALSM